MQIKYTKDYLIEFVKNATSWATLIRNLGLKNTGGNHRNIQLRVRQYELDTSHFKKSGWNKGLTAQSNISVLNGRNKRQRTDEDIFSEHSGYGHSKLSKRMIATGEWKYECAICSLTEWRGQKIVLHVDHIDGKHWNHTKENLRFLCPLCHSQTHTYCRGNKIKKDSITSERKERRISLKVKCCNAECDNMVNANTKTGMCRPCLDILNRRVSRPSKEELLDDMKTLNFLKLGLKYGVSDNAVRKWCKSYEILTK